jgi:hypothetical protein
MTNLPPPANEAGADDPHLPERHHSERGATGRSRQQASNPQLELAAPIRSASRPFVWQHGSQLYLLVNETPGWVLAELEFVPSACHYVEIRRTAYRWPREAAGVLLSRSLATDADTVRQLANDVTAWLATSHEPVSVWHREQDA